MKIGARSGNTFNDRDAIIINKFLTSEFRGETFTAEEVLEKAKNPRSPVHKYFQWDDSRAAHLYRLAQARKMITCYFVEIDGVASPSAVSVRYTPSENKSYMFTEKAVHNEDIWASVMAEALQGLQSWKFRYASFKQLKELQPVVREITKLEDRHGKKDNKAKRGRSNKNTTTSSENRRDQD